MPSSQNQSIIVKKIIPFPVALQLHECMLMLYIFSKFLTVSSLDLHNLQKARDESTETQSMINFFNANFVNYEDDIQRRQWATF